MNARLAVIATHPVGYQSPIFRRLVARGVDLTVYFCSDFGMQEGSFDLQFNRVVAWGTDAMEGYPSRVLANRSLRPGFTFFGHLNPGIVPALLRGRYDALWVNGWDNATTWLGVLAAKCVGTRVLLRGETPLMHERFKRGWKRAVRRIVLGIFFRFVDGFLYIGEENRRFYTSFGVPERKLFFVPYAVDNDAFRAAHRRLLPRRAQIRRALGVGPRETLVLGMGKLIGKKRPLDLVRACEAAARKAPLRLVIVGEGNLRGELERYIGERSLSVVSFPGFADRAKIAEYYAAADVFVLPSGLGETWGLVVNEALCFGLPAIVSDLVGSGPDLVREGENGWIVPCGDVAALAGGIIRAADPAFRKRAAAVSRGIAARYDYDHDADGIIAAIAQRHAS